MKLSAINKTNLPLRGILAVFTFLLLTPCISQADLKELGDSDLRTVYLNDFVRPFTTPIIVQTYDGDLQDIENQFNDMGYPVAVTITTFDFERLYSELAAQNESIQNGNGPVEGLYPYVEDPSYLLKQETVIEPYYPNPR